MKKLLMILLLVVRMKLKSACIFVVVLQFIGCGPQYVAQSPDTREGVPKYGAVNFVANIEAQRMTVQDQECILTMRDGLAAFAAWGSGFYDANDALYEQVVALEMRSSVLAFHTFNMESMPGERVHWILCDQDTLSYTYAVYKHDLPEHWVKTVPLALMWWCGP